MQYFFIILLFFAHTTHAQRSDLEGRHLSGKIKVYKQVTHRIYSFTHGINSASTDSSFTYYDKKGMLTKYVGYHRRCWVEEGDSSHHEWSVYVSDYHNDSKRRRMDTGYTYDFLKHDTDYHSHVYNIDENDHTTSVESNSWFSDGYTVRTVERNTYKEGRPDSVIAYTERKGEAPQIDMIKKFTYGAVTDTIMVYRISDIKFGKRIVVLNDLTGRRQMITDYDLDNGHIESTEYFLYSDEENEPEYKERQAKLDDNRNGYVIFTTKWNKDKHGNYRRTSTHKEEELDNTRFEIEYYK